MFVYVSSDVDSGNYFHGNTPTSFRVKLPGRINFLPQGKWEVALLDIDLPRPLDKYNSIYVCINSSICKPSPFNSSLTPILNRVYFNQISRGAPVYFDNPRYIPLSVDSLDIIDIYLTDSSGANPSFKQGKVNGTLHFRLIE